MKQLLFAVLVLLFICNINAYTRLFHALNTALTSVLESSDVKQAYANLGYSLTPSSPDCVESTYPSALPKTELLACHSQTDTLSLNFINAVREGLQTELSNKYKKSVTITLVPVDTGSSFFYFISNAVLTGKCDFSIATTIINAERARLVDFICPHAMSSNVIVRGTLEPEREITAIADLNQAGVRVSAVRGSTQETYLRANAALATIVTNSTSASLFDDLNEKRVHAVVASDVSFNRYVQASPCTDCQTYPFGDNTRMAIFLPKESSATVLQSSLWIMITLICTLMLL